MKLAAHYARVDWWLVLVAAAIALCGLLFIHSANLDRPDFSEQYGKQVLFLCVGFGVLLFAMLPHYSRALRLAWPLYVTMLAALVWLLLFGRVTNGARRWFHLPGFSIQPSEFAKLALVVVLAAWLRFKSRARTFDGLLVPIALAMLPAGLILLQPDLGSSLVLWPVLLAMCYAAGASGRSILLVLATGLLGGVLAFDHLHEYQQARIVNWIGHHGWTDELIADPEQGPAIQRALRAGAYQPWQALIAMGGGGWTGFGVGQGPQNRYDFLPYRSEDYIFAVIGEETGLLGCVAVLGLYAALVYGLLNIAHRTRERFGRLCCVGIAAWLGTQVLMHVAVCGWLVPATGLPLPMVSYGGSSTLAALLGVALCLNVGARREVVFAPDGFH